MSIENCLVTQFHFLLGWIRTVMKDFPWKKKADGAVQLRTGYDVYVGKTVLRDLLDHFGPESTTGWSGYAWRLVLHLLGGSDQACRIKDSLHSAGVKGGVDRILLEETICAVIGTNRFPSRLRYFIH